MDARHDDVAREGAPRRAQVATAQVDGAPSAPVVGCRELTASALGVANLKITKAQEIAATTGAQADPAHCQINGTINERKGADGQAYAISFELRMPMQWNRRFFFQGGAGTDGFLLPARGTLPDGRAALALGYAVVSTDGGHALRLLPLVAGGAMFGLDPQARVDYGYNAIGTLTPIAKRIVARFYGAEPTRSYFVGCSNGGRQAMVSAARFADQFDGILAGDPGFNLPKAGVQHAWDVQQWLAVTPSKIADAFTVAEMKVVGQRILDKCDALDGASDGVVYDTRGCQQAFALERDVDTCAGERTGACLTAAQKRALNNVMTGPKNSRGEPLYSDWPWDPGIASAAPGGASWRAWKLENAAFGGPPMIATMGGSALPYIFITPPVDVARGTIDATAAVQKYLLEFSFDVDAPKIDQTSGAFTESAMSYMTPPNPTRLETLQRRGKMIVYHGAADGVFSVNDTIRWYDALRTDMPDAERFAKLYVVPGMGHCGGGSATDRFDLFTPLVAWVEGGGAPESVVARRAPGNPDVPASWSADRTGLLCPYPRHAVLTSGATHLESASSFHCE